MYAIINKGNGKFYTSMVFACYKDRQTENETNYWNQYVIFLNENKTALVKRYFFDSSRRPYLNKMVIITDGNLKNWNIDDNTGCGELEITNRQSLFDMVRDGTVSDALLNLDNNYFFEEYPEIKTSTDIENLTWASDGFHDACIKSMKKGDDVLYVLFDGIWGCKIEMWFSGDV